MQFWHIQIFTGWFNHFLLSLLENFPKLDALAVACQHLHVLTLISQPINTCDFLLHVHTSKWIELFCMRLKLSKVFVLLFLFFIIFKCFKHDDATGLISETQELATVIKLYNWNNIFLHYFLVGPLVAEQLIKFVVGALAQSVFLHTIFF